MTACTVCKHTTQQRRGNFSTLDSRSKLRGRRKVDGVNTKKKKVFNNAKAEKKAADCNSFKTFIASRCSRTTSTNRFVLQKTDLQFNSKNVLQFYSFQKPERSLICYKHGEKKKKKKRKAIAKGNKHVDGLSLGTAVLMFNSTLTGGGSKEAGRSHSL